MIREEELRAWGGFHVLDNMRRILFIDLQKEITQDVEIACLIASANNNDFEIRCANSTDGIDGYVSSFRPDTIILSYEAMKNRDSWFFDGIQVAYYAKNRAELEAGAEYGLPTIGIAPDVNKLMENILKKPYAVRKNKPSGKKDSTVDSAKEEMAASLTEKKETAPQRKPERQTEYINNARKDLPDGHGMISRSKNEKNPGFECKTKNPPTVVQSQKLDVYEEDEELDWLEGEDAEYSLPGKQSTDSGQGEGFEMLDVEEEELLYDTDIDRSVPRDTFQNEVEDSSQSDSGDYTSSRSYQSEKEYAGGDRNDSVDVIEQEYKKDLIGKKRKTKVVSVYAAKGGVGKTTIATELAVYLSLVKHGPRQLRVCIVDYNIDFGDVRSTLSLDAKGYDLTHWAAEVQELLESGKTPDEIVYNKEDIESWLRVVDECGLYVLTAPSSNVDSMEIESESLRIILDNIIKNGEFDFVICDTGNNTRDSTMIALERADTILMLMTQNVNTANCDVSFMNTMGSIDFDLSHTKLVINSIMPQRATGMSVQEIIDYFPYECIGKIRFNTDVIQATNLGKPLAFRPNNEFTKQLRSIVAYVLDDEEFKEGTAKKKKLFGFLSRKKER